VLLRKIKMSHIADYISVESFKAADILIPDTSTASRARSPTSSL
jgi:hypothetical protein